MIRLDHGKIASDESGTTSFFDMIAQLALETLAIAGCAFAIALVLGLPAATLIVRGGIIGKIVATLATCVRAVPDLVLAIICVAALGLGAGRRNDGARDPHRSGLGETLC